MHRSLPFRIVLAFAALLLVLGSPLAAKTPKKIAILPFTINADRDLTFLQEGIVDMLASRLAWKGELEVLEKGLVRSRLAGQKGPLNREAAIAIGNQLQVDFVVLGSLTVFGDSVSVDARILDVAKADELVTAYNQAKGMDAVIPTINQFAQDVNEKVMGRPMGSAVQTTAPEGPSGPLGLIGGGRDFEGRGLSHAQGIRTEIVSLDAGDVDGDGVTELVFASPDAVYVHKWKEKGFVQFSMFKDKWADHIVYVSVADLNADGKAEIYVSNTGYSDVSSLVLEWDGKDLVKVAEKVPWFLRVIDMPGRGKVLIGQKRELGKAYLGDVVFLTRQGNRFDPGEPLPLNSRVSNIYNFAFADFDGAGKIDTILLDFADHLRLYESGSEQIWKSEEAMGGNYTFININSVNQDQSTEHVFIPSPIFITDVDEDGQKEVMICKNTDTLRRFLERFRNYSSGTLQFLVREPTGLSMKWQTKRLGGAIVGYKIADFDNDKLPELVVASVISEDRMGADARTRIVTYDLK